MNPVDITQHFHTKIPLSREMGLEVREISSSRAVVAVPLKPNINHVHTVFGGSLYSAAALSCYALFQALALEAGGLSDELVIQEGRIQYLAPVGGDFTVESSLENQGDDKEFITTLRRKGRARLKLKASVLYQGKVCAAFAGTYVFRTQN